MGKEGARLDGGPVGEEAARDAGVAGEAEDDGEIVTLGDCAIG